MIGRKAKSKDEVIVEGPKGFDDFALRLGDMMRGERATMGKSLLDVQRELRIKASYIAAIENCDPDAFETQGFIAGYVRSYARYLDMDPDATFQQFCAESGFASTSGMDEGAKSQRRTAEAVPVRSFGMNAAQGDPFANPALPFSPKDDSVFSRLEPGAIGSMTVLIALIGALGYGGWSVLQEVQRVQLAPVEQSPVVLSDLDPLAGATAGATQPSESVDQIAEATSPGVFAPPTAEGLDRLYRPQALDVPVLVARDAPISSLDPSQFGAFAGVAPELNTTPAAPGLGQAVAPASLSGDGVQVVAARPAWVRIRDGEEVLFSGILNAGQTFDVPQTAQNPNIEVGESGAVYYAVNGETFGPAGPRGTVTSDLSLIGPVLAAALPKADPLADSDLGRVLADLGGQDTQPNIVPQVLGVPGETVTVVAATEAWVRVRSAEGTVLFEGVMAAGDFYSVPATEGAPTIRTGNAGAIYFAANGQTYGPYGSNGEVADNLALSADVITTRYDVATVRSDSPVASAVAALNAARAGTTGQ